MKRPRLWKEIATVLAVKLVLLGFIFMAFFGPAHRPAQDSAAVSDRLLGTENR